jgi:hypothetical protein
MNNIVVQPGVWRWLEAKGAVKAYLSYSGGNDEGGVDEVVLALKDGMKVSLPTVYVSEMWDEAARTWRRGVYDGQSFRALTEDERMIAALCQPVEDRYGSFAGEFYVNGTLVYDVAQRTAKADGHYRTTYEESETW